ncbi:hypothetical protein K3U93_11440 [Mycobacterium malmoense]|uniref:hypothetical protein n=1 Tax=Mycobacterium malmoense TaxID=1780 RepID=UPI00159405F4|nr:hypothetical protein [Mycobacterium malmoense]QZA19653.1 hypothetical protein K3U93_11440 [Mycobacterium malmoense]UNB96405.1 hypothetical protein H5T25_11430 [Mycobacterium malmoense]
MEFSFLHQRRDCAATDLDSGDRPWHRDAHGVALTDQRREMQIRVRMFRPV